MSLDDDLKDWAAHRSAPPPTDGDVDRLLADAAAPASRRWLWLVGAAGLGTGGLALAALGLVVGWSVLQPVEAPPVPEPVVVAPAVEAPEAWTGRVEHEGDVFAIDGSLTPTTPGHYELDGTVVVEAAPRGEGPPLVVAAAEHEVTVVGTVFTVVSDPFSVEVAEGVVRVTGGEGSWTLEAGDRFVDGAVVRPVPAPAPAALPGLDEARQRLREGDLDGAEGIVRQWLERDPEAADAWRLLAAIAARRGDVDGGLLAWAEVEAHGSEALAQRARFEQGTLLGAVPEAVAVWRRFLETPDPLAPEARLGLARALEAAGDGAGARVELERVVEEHPGTGAAVTARALLGG